MTIASRTISAVLDTFQCCEGIWRTSIPLSYIEIYKALEDLKVGFAEWDPSRGLYFLDCSTLKEELITTDITMIDFNSPQGFDHYRFEWAQGKKLAGIELQTHAPGPLPFVQEISTWIFPEYKKMAENPMNFNQWISYLQTLSPQNPLL
jgi:hypothetical protein